MLTSSLGCQVPGFAGLGVGDEEMAALAFVPFIPVADHQVIVGAYLGLGGFLLLVLGGGLVGGLARVDRGREGDLVSLRRPDRARDADRQVG